MNEPSAPSRWLFAHRVESAALIGGIGFFFFLITPVHFTRLMAKVFGGPEETMVRSMYMALAVLNALASFIRIWAGGTLGGARMMSVHVQTAQLITSGPYRHVRNPIYLADILTLAGMGLVVPLPGSLLVWFLLLALYPKLMAYEEWNLTQNLGQPYRDYCCRVPRLIWRFSASPFPPSGNRFDLSEGLVNNFIYLPLVPGFLVCAATGRLWHGVAVGAVGPLGWIALHFWRNFKRGGLAGDQRHHERKGI